MSIAFLKKFSGQNSAPRRAGSSSRGASPFLTAILHKIFTRKPKRSRFKSEVNIETGPGGTEPAPLPAAKRTQWVLIGRPGPAAGPRQILAQAPVQAKKKLCQLCSMLVTAAV